MILISHRGNTVGKKPKLENSPMYITNALNDGFDVEIDVWYDKGWWLGHDRPEHRTDMDYLTNGRFWIHCKNISALTYIFNTRLNYFWHEEDCYTLTSHGYIWAYPGEMAVAGAQTIAVMPEINNTELDVFDGVCSDIIGFYKGNHEASIIRP